MYYASKFYEHNQILSGSLVDVGECKPNFAKYPSEK